MKEILITLLKIITTVFLAIPLTGYIMIEWMKLNLFNTNEFSAYWATGVITIALTLIISSLYQKIKK